MNLKFKIEGESVMNKWDLSFPPGAESGRGTGSTEQDLLENFELRPWNWHKGK
jgi:hypothetical protein